MIPALRVLVPGIIAAAALLPPAVLAARPTAQALALACAGCHGTAGRSLGSTPALAGKGADQILRNMRDFKSGRRKSSIMNRIAAGYQDGDFAALATYFAEGANP